LETPPASPRSLGLISLANGKPHGVCLAFGGKPAKTRRTLGNSFKLLRSGNWSALGRQLLASIRGQPAPTDYELWRQIHAVTSRSRRRMRKQIRRWTSKPKISFFLDTGWPNKPTMREPIESLIRQIYPEWELLATDPRAVAIDPRIRTVPADLASAINVAMGEYFGVLNPVDQLPEHAFFRVAEAIIDGGRPDMIYSDEDILAADGRHIDPFFKPDWSPEYFLAWMYTGPLAVYRTDLLKEIGGWRDEYDLILRLIAKGAKIHHIPDVLYHRTSPAPQASVHEALQNYLDSTGRKASIESGLAPGLHRIRYAIVGEPLVSIVIPSACRPVRLQGHDTWFLLECVLSIRRLSTYRNIEIIALDNNDMPEPLAAALEPLDVRRIPFTQPFNLARKMNLGAFSARGEQLTLLNDDIEVISPDWIESMLEFSQWPEIGAVGAKLLFPNNTQQHTGVILLNGNPRHPFYGCPADHPGYFHSSQVHRNWSAVTGACMMTSARNFKAVGGFSENFPLNYNDVDYCLKLLNIGKRIVYTPYARLHHHEAVSKTGTHDHEFREFRKTWMSRFPCDPYYNPNLGRHFRVRI
jgi:O-antigen biosynthesis protein